jgi:hypothetical protein
MVNKIFPDAVSRETAPFLRKAAVFDGGDGLD